MMMSRGRPYQSPLKSEEPFFKSFPGRLSYFLGQNYVVCIFLTQSWIKRVELLGSLEESEVSSQEARWGEQLLVSLTCIAIQYFNKIRILLARKKDGVTHYKALSIVWGFSGGSDDKASICSTGDLGSSPGLGRSPGEGNSYPLQYSGLENSMDCIVHGVTESDTTERLSLSLSQYGIAI